MPPGAAFGRGAPPNARRLGEALGPRTRLVVAGLGYSVMSPACSVAGRGRLSRHLPGRSCERQGAEERSRSLYQWKGTTGRGLPDPRRLTDYTVALKTVAGKSRITIRPWPVQRQTCTSCSRDSLVFKGKHDHRPLGTPSRPLEPMGLLRGRGCGRSMGGRVARGTLTGWILAVCGCRAILPAPPAPIDADLFG
jgi:hypothetical protein